MSVKVTPLSVAGLLAGLLTTMDSVDTPFTSMVVGAKDLAMAGGPITTALAAAPAPA